MVTTRAIMIVMAMRHTAAVKMAVVLSMLSFLVVAMVSSVVSTAPLLFSPPRERERERERES